MEIKVTKKAIKNIYLRVTDKGEVEVTAPYWYTNRQIDEFVRSKAGWISRNLEKQRIRKEKEPEYLAHPELREEARRRLRARLEERAPLMEARTGLKASSWKIRDMKSRWGSCNTETRAITINLRLADRSDRELDYIILHELCHIKERHHDRAFWSLVEKYMPDWKEVRRKLRE